MKQVLKVEIKIKYGPSIHENVYGEGTTMEEAKEDFINYSKDLVNDGDITQELADEMIKILNLE